MGETKPEHTDAYGLGFERGRREGWRQYGRSCGVELPELLLAETGGGAWVATGCTRWPWSVLAWPTGDCGDEITIQVRVGAEAIAEVSVRTMHLDSATLLEEAQHVASALLWSALRAKGSATPPDADGGWVMTPTDQRQRAAEVLRPCPTCNGRGRV